MQEDVEPKVDEDFIVDRYAYVTAPVWAEMQGILRAER